MNAAAAAAAPTRSELVGEWWGRFGRGAELRLIIMINDISIRYFIKRRAG